MDWLDFIWKFSGELMVLGLAIGVAACNFYFFSGNARGYSDNSYAAAFLNNHYALNQKLYAKNHSIITTVAGNSGLIARAEADDFAGLDPANQPADSGSDSAAAFTADGIVAPSPDSIKAMVTNVTKKVYTTQAGDTLKSIAADNGISVNSIRWSNPALTSDALQPGWDLIIPPVDGVAVTASANDTLPDLAAKYNPDKYNSNKQTRDASAAQLLSTIISYNGLDSAEDINPGDFLIVPGGVVTAAPAPPAPPKAKPSTSSGISPNTVTSISGGYDDVNHYFPVGYCTYYVATRMKITFGGNAKNWLANARASGYVTSNNPAPRSVVVMVGNASRSMWLYGHVAYVESVNDDGTITVSEMNYSHFNRVDTRTISAADRSIIGYIYP